jgi:hypothetical protein
MKPLVFILVDLAVVLAAGAAPAERPSAGDTPTLRLKTTSQSGGRRPVHVLVLEGDGAGQIHRPGPEHFKLTREPPSK